MAYAAGSKKLATPRGFEPPIGSSEFSSPSTDQVVNRAQGIRSTDHVLSDRLPSTKPFDKYQAERNQRLRFLKSLRVRVSLCSCGHSSLAHSAYGCEGLADGGGYCYCRGAK